MVTFAQRSGFSQKLLSLPILCASKGFMTRSFRMIVKLESKDSQAQPSICCFHLRTGLDERDAFKEASIYFDALLFGAHE